VKRDYPGLDIVRFGAAAMVAVYHLFYWWWLPKQRSSDILQSLGGTGAFSRWGWVGVQIFFVLSGFVIAFTADGRKARTFAKNRALRLYPMAWLCASATFLVSGGEFAAYVRSVFLIPSGPWVSGVYWTLSIEIIFYIVVALSLRLGLGLAKLATVFGVVGGGYWLLRTLDYYLGKPIRPFFELIEGSRFGGLTLLTTGCFFAMGMLLWSMTVRRSPWYHYPLLILCLGAGALQILSAARAGFEADGVPGLPYAPIVIWLVAIAAIVASIVWNDVLLERLGKGRLTLRALGLMTYPLYLVHSEVGRDAGLHLMRWLPSTAAIAIAFALVFLLSWLLSLVEKYPKTALRWLLEVPELRGLRNATTRAN